MFIYCPKLADIKRLHHTIVKQPMSTVKTDLSGSQVTLAGQLQKTNGIVGLHSYRLLLTILRNDSTGHENQQLLIVNFQDEAYTKYAAESCYSERKTDQTIQLQTFMLQGTVLELFELNQ